LKTRVCSVSYLNSTPLVWGLLHGPQRERLDLRFELPAVCAGLLRTADVDIGLVPVIELERQPLEIVPGLGIASTGAVRSILLISKVEAGAIRTLAADSSSRTSVVLAQILLAEKYGARPAVTEAFPAVDAMLERADACLVIGDPALRVNPDTPGLHVYDLGAEWTGWSGLPMVYAVWAARAGFDWEPAGQVLQESWEFGRTRIGEIAAAESGARGVSEDLARVYLTRNIEFVLSDNHRRGLAAFRQLARASGLV
jgi:predicted solute-binding protein